MSDEGTCPKGGRKGAVCVSLPVTFTSGVGQVEQVLFRAMSILVVDDEVSICSCVADFLRREGLDVAEAYDGYCALQIAAELGVGISAVLTDVNMPGMDGIEMWRRMKPLVAPDCKVLFMSGFAQKLARDGVILPKVIEKPFTFHELLAKFDLPPRAASAEAC
jgi:CheY-like chemotaxis protein